MSDKFQTLTVGLDRERGDEALKPIIEAIMMVKGVAVVKVGEVKDMNAFIAQETMVRELLGDFITLLSIARGDQTDGKWSEVKRIVEGVRQKRGY